MKKEIKSKFNTYPTNVKNMLLDLRTLIYHVAGEESIASLEESLKWGEAAYTSNEGSAIRLDWKEKNPDCVSVFFNCRTKLIETFRELYPNALSFSGNRAIDLPINAPIPVKELSHCFALALKYHKVKHLPLLGG